MLSAPRFAMVSRVALIVFAFILGSSRVASAAPSNPSPFALDFDNQLGWVHGQHNGGVDLGTTVRLRYRIVTAGLSLQGATILLNSMGSVSAVAGVSAPIEFMRLDVLAELGLNGYTGVGSNFMSHDPGARAVLPFVGGRAALLVRVAQNRGGLGIWLGPSVHYAEDLYSSTRTYTYRYQDQSWFDGYSIDELITRTVRVGQTRLSVLATLSISLPL